MRQRSLLPLRSLVGIVIVSALLMPSIFSEQVHVSSLGYGSLQCRVNL